MQRIGDLIAKQIGGGWGAEVPDDTQPVAAYVIRGTDIPRALVGDVSKVPLRYHKRSALESRRLQHDDIVFEVSGGSKGQPVGRALLVNDTLLEKFSQSVMCASFCKLIRFDASICDPRFLFRILQLAYVDGTLSTYQVQSTGITNFSWKPFLDRFEVELPDRTEQARISATLDAFDDLIENNRRRIEILEETARLLYREWFVHFRFPGHEDVEFVDSELGPIPGGWRVTPLEDAAVVSRGLSWSRDLEAEVGTRVLTIPNIGAQLDATGATRLSDVGQKERKKYSVEEGDLLVIGSNGNPARVGHSVWVPAGTDALFASFLMRVRPLDGMPPVLLRLHVSNDALMDHLRSGAVGSTGLRNLRVTAFRSALLVRAPESLERSFEEIVRPMRALEDCLMRQNEALREARDLLLPRLVSGELDVSNLDLESVI